MRTALIGHRGTGKSAFLRRIKSYYEHESRQVLCFDLDREIEKRTGRGVRDIFETEGEGRFRRIEVETFEALDKETSGAHVDVFIACGAGFDPHLIPTPWRCLWVRRASDAKGRVFFDRPRLDAEAAPLEEFLGRFQVREAKFASRVDEVIWLDEGLETADEAECGFVLGDLRDLGGAVTVMPSRMHKESFFETWARMRLEWGVKWFELRDDLLNEEQMERAIRFLPDDRVLVSFRDREKAEQTARFVERHALAFDWPHEFGPSIWGEPRFLSLHSRDENETLTEALAKFPLDIPVGTQLKAALPTRNLDELKLGHEWSKAFPEARIFLPMSADGRWAWYRLLQGRSYDLNFIRDIEASAADQPTLLQWARRVRLKNSPGKVAANERVFAAVLGDPVAHSRTPMEHKSFFAGYEAPVFAIRVPEEEWDLDVLRSLGLRWAAVTSPLKHLAYESAGDRDFMSDELGSVNTLRWDEGRRLWEATNTDREGFAVAVEQARQEAPLGAVAVWGGGGTLNVVKSVLPGAELFSLQTGENRSKGGVQAQAFSPQTVVWAVGRWLADVGEPPSSWKPDLVLDLNYGEDSPGRDYALKIGCRYMSGLAMFRAQAEAQRRFWETP